MLKELGRFLRDHDHIPDLALENAGEHLMDGPSFLKLRRAFEALKAKHDK